MIVAWRVARLIVKNLDQSSTTSERGKRSPHGSSFYFFVATG